MRVFFCLFLFLSLSCSNNNTDCIPVIFDQFKYETPENFGISLIDLETDGICLKVKLGVSGCDDNHNIEMVSDGAVAPSDPTMVFFDFYDDNPQICEAYFLIDEEFDLTPIKEKYKEDIIIAFRNNQGTVLIEN